MMASETQSIVISKLSEEVVDIDSTPKALAENNNSSLLQETSLDNRLKRKAKRPSKSLSSEESVENVINVNGSYLRYTKNSRKSRSGFGRGLPKKGIL